MSGNDLCIKNDIICNVFFILKMSDLFLQDDIIDVLKSKIDIRDYDKLKRVSLKYKRYFDLKPLIDSKKYDDIVIIYGCSVDILTNIITRHIMAKYNYAEVNEITEQILKHRDRISLSLENKGHYILKSIIALYYNCYNNNYKGIIMSLWIFHNICNKNMTLANLEYFIQPVISYIEDVNRDNVLAQFNIDDYGDDYDENYNNVNNSKMLICINLNIYFSIIMKRLKIIIPENSEKKIDKQMIDVINSGLRENVLEYIDFNINALSFPNYYINYVKYLCNNIML
jgi:hypothetical protein